MDELEALLVRSIALHLLNKKMERFDQQRKERSFGKRKTKEWITAIEARLESQLSRTGRLMDTVPGGLPPTWKLSLQ